MSLPDDDAVTCERCGLTIDPTKTSALHAEDGRMIGIVDEYSHVCVDGWMVHPAR